MLSLIYAGVALILRSYGYKPCLQHTNYGKRHNDKRNDDFWIDFSSIERSRIEPPSTGAVEDAVEENFETYPKDSACEDKDCTEAEEDWASSTAQRSFYGWSWTNLDDVMGTGAAPTYEKVGPVTYDITTTKTINAYDKDAGTSLQFGEDIRMCRR